MPDRRRESSSVAISQEILDTQCSKLEDALPVYNNRRAESQSGTNSTEAVMEAVCGTDCDVPVLLVLSSFSPLQSSKSKITFREFLLGLADLSHAVPETQQLCAKSFEVSPKRLRGRAVHMCVLRCEGERL